MIKKQEKNSSKALLSLAALLVMASAIPLFANQSDTIANKYLNMPFGPVETKPKFQGKDARAFVEWVNSQIQYPPELKAKGTQGTVYLSFDIDVDGRLINAKVIRGADPLLDAEALRVVNLSPLWEPGYNNLGKAKIPYQFPVRFKLTSDDTSTSTKNLDPYHDISSK
ncbi:MAG: energy transducer TonB [Prevotellaceae bacterium]|jgi:TonB family protein|nr:energy transducer TonB [Prevotellaceae bacterium]